MNTRSICYDFPNLRLDKVPKSSKFFEALRFLPKAIALLSSRNLRVNRTIHLYDKSGKLLGLTDGDLVYPLTDKDTRRISRLLILLEDRRFFRHHGVDLRGMVRSAIRNISARRIVQGGSTITQQLVRNTLITPDRSLARKLLEVVLAIFLEKHYTKEEILQLYCQTVYLGGGVRGFAAASRVLYRKPLAKLSSHQICGLLGLLRAPSTTYPRSSSTAFFSRQKFVTRVISSQRQALADAQIASERGLNPVSLEGVRKVRLSRIIDGEIKGGTGQFRQNISEIVLTLDSKFQRTLDSVLQEASRNTIIQSASGIVLDNRLGEVLAESSWLEGLESKFSPSFFGSIQPGSTFKTFALLSAIEQGFSSELLLRSSPFESLYIRDNCNNRWKVRNFAHSYRGNLSLKKALIYSDNTVYARLSELLDLKRLHDTYIRFGLCNPPQVHHSIVLGALASGVSLVQLATAYMAIARNGILIKPRLIKYVTVDGCSDRLMSNRSSSHIVAQYAAIMEIKSVLARSGVSLGAITISGKTGTTKSGSLFAGYTDDISMAIWLGFKRQVSENTKGITAKKTVTKFARMLGYRSELFSI